MPDNPPPNNPGNGGTGGGDNGYQTLAEFLTEADVLLTNAQLPEIAPLLAAAGYPASAIASRQGDLDSLRTLAEAQKNEYGDQYEAAEKLADTRAAYHPVYAAHVGLARLAFRNSPDATAALGLAGVRKASLSGYTTQGLLFYNNALATAEFANALSAKGIDNAALQDGKTAFEKLLQYNAELKKETGEAQKATKDRDAAYDDLQDWVSELRETAKIVLRDHPQLREQLGIKEVS